MAAPRRQAEAVSAHAEAEQVARDLRQKFGAGDPEIARLIEQAAACWRRAREAADLIAEMGLVLAGPQGPVRNPACAIEADARRTFSTYIRCLRDGVKRTKIGGPTVSERLPKTPTPTHVVRTYLQAP